jgi:type VI secretion system VasD/TssJ family lipoprotein
MAVKRIKEIVLLVALAILATSCLEKANNSPSTAEAGQKEVANKLWQWDDKQKNWVYNGSLFSPKPKKSSEVLWKKQEKAISLQVESAKSLTVFDNEPKALQMKVFQLSDSKAFLQAAQSTSGLKHLLVTDQIDPAVLSMERLIVLPGVSQSVTLDRASGTRYIGIVLGYANLDQQKIFRLIPIVALDDDNAADSSIVPVSLTSNTAAKPTLKTSGRPAMLKINLLLEANGIDKLDVDAK